jgi:NTP pyrophosphatase (non-canonical NTP hydrolase)
MMPELSLNEYQRGLFTYKKTHEECHALGIAGELAEVFKEMYDAVLAAGSIADMVKKAVSHGVAADRDALKKELGDVLWYVTAVANDNNLTLEEIAQANLQKLRERYPNGFVKGGGVREPAAPAANLFVGENCKKHGHHASWCITPNACAEHFNALPNIGSINRSTGPADIDLRGGVPSRTDGVYFNCGCFRLQKKDGGTVENRCADGECRRLARR